MVKALKNVAARVRIGAPNSIIGSFFDDGFSRSFALRNLFGHRRPGGS
jgi:hypothetical protein